MTARALKIDQLKLDLINPRISKASSQHDAMQKIIEDQDVKLANLAESIVDEGGLNPMDRLLVMKSEDGDGKYTVLEGNRRVFVIKILKSPAILTGLEIRSALQKRLEKAAASFNASSVEPLACFEVATRADGNVWIEQRHIGEDEGRGVVSWSGVASSRFRGRDPALQALDFVRQHAKLTDDQKKLLDGRFPITTLDRLLSTPDVRSRIGFDIKDDKLLTSLPPEEAIKPLKRIVFDLAEKKVNVTNLKLKTQQVEYITKLDAADRPDFSKKTSDERAVDSFGEHDFSRPAPAQPKKIPVARPVARHNVVPRGCRLNVNNAKIGEIYGELRTLQLAKHPHAIAVLLRMFLETSVDHYLTKTGILLTVTDKGGNKRDKSLAAKVQETVDHMVANGAIKKDFAGVIRSLSIQTHPLSPELLNSYVHNRFVSPTERDMTAAWDNAQPLFERVWP